MERRAFLSTLVTAVGAGTVTLATPEETMALSVGEPVSLAKAIAPHSDLCYPGTFLFVPDGKDRFVPIGILTEITHQADMQGNVTATFRGISQGRATTFVRRFPG